MGRPKGSKNKPKVIDANARIAAINGELEGYADQVVTLEETVAQTARILAEQRSDLRAVTRRVKALEKEKESLREVAEKQLRERTARELIDSYLDSGKSLDDLKKALS